MDLMSEIAMCFDCDWRGLWSDLDEADGPFDAQGAAVDALCPKCGSRRIDDMNPDVEEV